jgi:hypothetical protein
VEPPPEPVKPPVDAAPVIAVPTPPPPTPTPVPTPVPTPTPRPAPIQTGPVTVAPNAVTRLSGETATLGKSKRAEVPPVVAAKVCIDTSGSVASVQLLTKLERHTIGDLTDTLKTWRYAPYKQAGVAVPACFVVSFKVK